MNESDAAEAVLTELIKPIQSLLDDPKLTDLDINGPGIGIVNRGNGPESVDIPLGLRDLQDIALYCAAYTQQDISERTPILTAKLPGKLRVQVLIPPAVAEGKVVFSIRKPQAVTGTPEKLQQQGVFSSARKAGEVIPIWREKLQRLYEAEAWMDCISLAVSHGLNVVFSGKVNTGKTHNLRSFTHCIPHKDKIVTIEDMEELIDLPHMNVANLFYSTGDQGASNVTAEILVRAALRMGMKWMLNQELRDANAFAFMDVLESGHSGMTTVHSDHAQQTRSRICDMIKKHDTGKHMNRNDIMAGLARSIDMIVHCEKDGERRYVSEVLYDYEEQKKLIDLPPIFSKEAA